MLKRTALLLVAVLALSVFTFVPAVAAQGDEWPDRLVLGMVPSREAAVLVTNLEPLSLMLEERLDGTQVAAFVATNFTGLIEAMGTGRVDVGIFGPFALVLAEDRHGTEIILNSIRFGADHYRAQFNVRADSGIDTVEDMRGKTLGFVDPASTSGFLFPYVFLKEHGIDPETDLNYLMVGAHDAGVLSVYEGDVDISVSFEDARGDVQAEKPDVLDVVKVLAYTEPIPNDGIAVRKELHPDLVKAIQDAFVDISSTEEGVAILSAMYNVTGFVPADSERYSVVRRTYEIMQEFIDMQ